MARKLPLYRGCRFHQVRCAEIRTADASRREDNQALVSFVESHFGRLDFAFNNAGVDAVTVGYKNTAEIDEAIENLNLALA